MQKKAKRIAMFRKNSDVTRTTWSEEMLKEFLDSFGANSPSPGQIPFLVKRKDKTINIKTNRSKLDISVSYYGILARQGLDDVYLSLVNEPELKDISSKGEIRDLDFSRYYSEEEHDFETCIGYMELLNGIVLREGRQPVPMIRGFIKQDAGFFEVIDNLISETKIFNQKIPIILQIQILFWPDFYKTYFKTGEINTTNIFYQKMAIKSIEVSQSFDLTS